MTRFERQGQIFGEIQRPQAELDSCPSGSPDALLLRQKLNAALREYRAVPSDKARRKEIDARLDHLQTLEPSAETAEEFSALCQELREIPRPAPARRSARGMCHQLRWLIWIEAVALCLMTLLFAPGLLHTYMCGGVAVILILGFIASLVWAVWASGYKA